MPVNLFVEFWVRMCYSRYRQVRNVVKLHHLFRCFPLNTRAAVRAFLVRGSLDMAALGSGFWSVGVEALGGLVEIVAISTILNCILVTSLILWTFIILITLQNVFSILFFHDFKYFLLLLPIPTLLQRALFRGDEIRTRNQGLLPLFFTQKLHAWFLRHRRQILIFVFKKQIMLVHPSRIHNKL